MTKNGAVRQEKKRPIVGTVDQLKTLRLITLSAELSKQLGLTFSTLLYSVRPTMSFPTYFQLTKLQRSLKDGIRVNLGDITLILKNKPKST